MRVIDDSGEIWHASVYNVKYRTIKQGQYVRIRAASLVNHAGYHKTFGMRPYSNILTLPSPCKLADDMLFDEVAENKSFEKAQLADSGILMHPVIVSEIQDRKLTQTVSTLAEAVEDKAQETHRVRFSVSHTSSTDGAKCVRIREKNGELKQVPKG